MSETNLSHPIDASATQQWVSVDVARTIEAITRIYLCIPIALFGVVANIASIAVFGRLGFSEPINLKLMCLAVSDLLLFIFTLASGVTRFFYMIKYEGMILSAELSMVLFGWPISPLFQLSSLTTVFITLDRCLCITMPLAVNRILNQRNVSIILTALACLFVAILLPTFCVMRYVWREFENKSMFTAEYSGGSNTITSVSYGAISVLQFGCYGAMLICTAFLIVGFHRQVKKRQAMAQSQKRDSTKDQRLVKMVLLVAIVFIVFSLPELMLIVLTITKPEVYPWGSQSNTFVSVVGITRVTDCINGTVNIFIYLKMSTAFRRMFKKTFCC